MKLNCMQFSSILNLYIYTIFQFFSMNKFITCCLIFFLITQQASSQIYPKEGSLLNFRIAGFSFPPLPQTNKYTIEIAAGNYEADTSFNKNIIKKKTSKKNRIIIELPSFDAAYTWRAVYSTQDSAEKHSALYHFKTGKIPETDTANYRLRIIKPAVKFADGYIFSDYFKTLYDMSGHPIWYLPTTDSKGFNIRDLKITPKGSITYVIDEQGVFEISYSGAEIWKGPDNGTVSGDSTEHYHHQFTRLNNGHYLALGQNTAYINLAHADDSNLLILPQGNTDPDDKDKKYLRIPMGTLIEYDQNGRVLWSWRFSDHSSGTSVLYHHTLKGPAQMHPHENSFFFDEKKKFIYLSCRNLSRIIKIKYPEGNIVAIYGGSPATGRDIFCGQHSCSITSNGYLLLFNNNICNPEALSSVVMFQEQLSAPDSLKKIWEYECSSEIINSTGFPSGGNVTELPGQSVFISMAYPESKILIVNMNGDILWSAQAEKKNQVTKKWEPVNLYKASIIPDRKALEQLIWNLETTK